MTIGSLDSLGNTGVDDMEDGVEMGMAWVASCTAAVEPVASSDIHENDINGNVNHVNHENSSMRANILQNTDTTLFLYAILVLGNFRKRQGFFVADFRGKTILNIAKLYRFAENQDSSGDWRDMVVFFSVSCYNKCGAIAIPRRHFSRK
ncbi:MAG: hypothetical protein PHE53_04875 [Thermoguttaceae bacterium]|nr:hypothetical protein [Thermoguttaceae bacterium]